MQKQELTPVEVKVLNLVLNHGDYLNPIKFDDLRKESHISRRRLQDVLESLKLKGHLIGSRKTKPNGLYMAKNAEQLEAGMRANIKQAETTLKIAQALRDIDLASYWRDTA